jgi:hypothetical protein
MDDATVFANKAKVRNESHSLASALTYSLGNLAGP